MVTQLIDLQRRAGDYARRDGRIAADDFFYAEQNARLVKKAEQYYRTMFQGRVDSWNLRDLHMAETLDSLVEHFGRQGHAAKVVLWEHNSHLGDARATQMGRRGEWNVGQLVREKRGRDCVLIGFTTYSGTVTAASNWGGPSERGSVRRCREATNRYFMKRRYRHFCLRCREVPRLRGHSASRCWNARLA